VGPRYHDKYRTAAENALHNCYRNSLVLLKENKLRTIAFTVIHSERKGYPLEIGAHIVARTIRRFLENWGEDIDRIILVVSTEVEMKLYGRLLPLYFPRNEEEEILAKSELPRDTGNEFGETVIEERRIRISAFPTTDFGNISVLEGNDQNEKPTINFTEMHNNPDENRKNKIKKAFKETDVENDNLYYKFLRQAHQLDLSEIARLQIIYQSGCDNQGRPIVMIIGSRLPEKRAHLDRVFLYIIKTLDKIVENDYVFVYLHTNMENKSKPEFSWLEQIYNQIDRKYNAHLRAFYILHPTFWLKLLKAFFSTFAGDTDFWQKVINVEKLVDLFDVIDPNQLVIPQDVLEYDERENGPLHTNRSSNRGQTSAESLVNDL